MSYLSKYSKQGNYTAYVVPDIQIEGSGLWMYDDLQEMIDQWYGAIEIFDTPGMTMEKLREICPLKDAKIGALLNWLRENYKSVYKSGDFWSDQEEVIK